MDPDDWNLDQDRPLSPYGLPTKQREFLITGNTGSYSQTRLKREISEKSAKQMDRIQDLLDDLYLLCYGNYLAESEEQVRDEISDLNFPSKSSGAHDISQSREHKDNSVANLSFEIGLLFRMAGLDGQRTHEIVWSFLLGLVGTSSGDFQRESERIGDMLEEINTLYEQRVVREGTNQVTGKTNDISELHKITKSVLRDANINPSIPLTNAVVQYHLRPNESNLALSVRSISEMEAVEWQSNDGPERQVNGIQPRDRDETTIDTIVQRLLSETPLREVEHLRDDLKIDRQQILTREKFGAQADEIFHGLPPNGARAERDNLRVQIDTSVEMLTAVLNRLSAKSEHPSWTSRPVVEESAEKKWSLTKYGQLLHKTMSSGKRDNFWVHYIIADPEELSIQDRELLREVMGDADV
ncbi:hypothetical protein [Halorubrum saccharovorum]|uniref:hypothetical protein n=1 Tax=Halorubrum saccharovorum TaxID=2248 RepID=UPI001268BD35|nr:hypothetical protein [Halorubrum saccharovorum]